MRGRAPWVGERDGGGEKHNCISFVLSNVEQTNSIHLCARIAYAKLLSNSNMCSKCFAYLSRINFHINILCYG